MVKKIAKAFLYKQIGYHYFTLPDYPIHTHKQWEIVLVIEGKVEHIINNTSEILQKNELVFIRPNDIHGFKQYKKYTAKHINIFMENSAFEDFLGFFSLNLKETLLLLNKPLKYKLTNIELERFKRIIDYEKNTNVMQNYSTDAINTFIAKLFFTEFLMLIYDKISPISNDYPSWLKIFLSELNNPENFDKNITEIALSTHYCPDYLTKKFKQYLNKTPIEYFSEIKLSYAQNMLTNTENTIAYIANFLGYASISHFNHLFKNTFGVTPTIFRNNKKNDEIKKTLSSWNL